MCLDDCENSFLKWRSFIELDDEWFLNGYYCGTILAVVGSDLNDQIMTLTIPNVEG
jgi:hypothetical protein